MDFGNNRLQSEFSGDINYLTRLNALLFTCDEAAMALDVYSWFHGLLALYRELSTEMVVNKKDKKCPEMEKAEEFVEKINPMLTDSIEDSKKSGAVNVTNELYNEIHKFELFLRSVIKKSGLQNKMKEDAGAALR